MSTAVRAPLSAPSSATVRPGVPDLFTLSIDPARRHLLIVTRGLWDEQATAAFGPALVTAITALLTSGCAMGTLRTLMDVREALMLPQVLIGSMQALAEEHGCASERIAVLCSSTLQKLQYRRITPQSMFAHFTDQAEAERWLFAD